ncbi:MAG: hypothetical protein IKF42_03510 [Mogibacterium sp.]|nr:hypothetical protein [Mogibacterium sp.]
MKKKYRKKGVAKSYIILAPLLVFLATIFFIGTCQTFAAGENAGQTSGETDSTELSDGYEPSEYRLANDAINEWEDRVLIAATGRYESEGRVYYAYSDYVDELISYFTKDDLELTEKDAKDAIAQITDPNNAKAGAMSGYLYQIGGKPKDENTLIDNGEYDGKVYPEFDENVRFANEEEYRASDLYLNNKAYLEERTNTVYESQSAMRKEMKDLAKADRIYQKILSAKPADASITEITASKGAGIAFAIVSGLLLILTAAAVFYGWRSSTISILIGPDDERWNRGNTHKDRHRIRKITAILLAAVVAIDLAVACSGLTYYSTFGSNKFMEEATDKGGICQHSYMQFRDNVHDFLSKNSMPINALDRALTYRDYRFDYIKGIKSAIKNGSGEVVYRGIQESVESQIDLLAYVTKKDSKEVVSGINEMYEESLSAETGLFIHDLRESLKGPYVIGFILSIMSLLLAAVMMVFERHNIYKGIKDLAIGALAGTALWGVITAAAAIVLKSGPPAIADDQVYVLLNTAGGGILPFMLVLLGIAMAVSAILFGTSWLMERRR